MVHAPGSNSGPVEVSFVAALKKLGTERGSFFFLERRFFARR